MTARELALRVVRDVFPPADARAPARKAQASLDYHLRRERLSDRDRAFAAELAYGAIKLRRTLDWYLDPFIGAQRELPSVVREILRLALYELAYTRADEHATVFEFVNVARHHAHRGLANLVNAVLRRFLRERPAQPRREQFESDADYFATRYSLPTWLVRQWCQVFGEAAEAVCAAVNEPAQPAIVVNTLAASRDEIAARLAESGVETRRSALVPEALLVRRGRLSPEADRAWWTQSESSAVPVNLLGVEPGEAILDVCSGRGSKALQIAGHLAGRGELVCIERDARKVGMLVRRLEESGVAAHIVTGDATTDLLKAEQRFDRVLLDAPCSGVGVVGRHPEARWKKQGADGERLAVTQRTLLERVARHVNPRGVLVYAVCSTDPRETTEVIDGFLARENFKRGFVPAAYQGLLTADGDVSIPPGIDGRDGFYIARIERRS